MYLKKKKISDLIEGEIIQEDVFVVKIKKTLRDYANGKMFNLILSDNSGQSVDFAFFGKITEEVKVKQLFESIKEDKIILIKSAKVNKFKEKLSVVVDSPEKIQVLNEGEYNPSDFIKKSKKNIDGMYTELTRIINLIENPELKAIVMAFFGDKEFADKFKKHPGAIEIHHNWEGGLLEHTIETVHYCLLTAKMFPTLNKDLMVAGAILHDIGKIREIDVTTRIKGSREGQLLGHTSIGVMMLSEKFSELNTSQKIREKLTHIVLSHLGKLEWGSAKEPMFPEAIAVHYADNLSAKITEISEFIENTKNSTENEFMYSRRNNRNILLD